MAGRTLIGSVFLLLYTICILLGLLVLRSLVVFFVICCVCVVFVWFSLVLCFVVLFCLFCCLWFVFVSSLDLCICWVFWLFTVFCLVLLCVSLFVSLIVFCSLVLFVCLSTSQSKSVPYGRTLIGSADRLALPKRGPPKGDAKPCAKITYCSADFSVGYSKSAQVHWISILPGPNRFPKQFPIAFQGQNNKF